MTAPKKTKSNPSWNDVKAKLAGFDTTEFIQLVSNLYAFDKSNQSFLHARFALGDDPLEIYKKRIDKALYPNVMGRNCQVKVWDAKKAVSEYQKAVGSPTGLLELRLYFCEVGLGFASEYGYEDEGFFNAICVQFKAAVKVLVTLDEDRQDEMLDWFYDVLGQSCSLGYGIDDDMIGALSDAGFPDERPGK